MSVLNELKRRNVLRVGAAYVVAAWLLIQVAETIFPLFGFDDTPARIVVIVVVIGLVPSLIFAWVFELTPEGLLRDKDVDRSQADTPRSSDKLNRTIMVLLVLALAGMALGQRLRRNMSEALFRKVFFGAILVLGFYIVAVSLEI